MKVDIKIATTENLKDIQGLNLLLFKKEHAEFDKTLNCDWTFSKEGEEYFKEHFSKSTHCAFVAEVNDKIVGYLVGEIHQDKIPYRNLPLFAELENMLVMEDYRGQGIGDELFRTFIDWCKTKGVGRIRVVASAKNKGAINFYHKNGLLDYDLALEADI